MRENRDQNNAEYGHFLRSVTEKKRLIAIRKLAFYLVLILLTLKRNKNCIF